MADPEEKKVDLDPDAGANDNGEEEDNNKRTKEQMRDIRKEQYAKAEAHVQSVYQTEAPPYSDTALETMLTTLHETIAPACQSSMDRPWLDRLLKRLSEAQPEIHVPVRTSEEWQRLFPRYPTTNDGFVQSLAIDDYPAIRDTLDKYGLVVVRALDDATCDATVTALFDEVNELARQKHGTDQPRKEDIHPDQPWTWEDRQWPTSNKFLIPQPALHPQAFQNRVAPQIYHLFVHLWGGETRLRSTIDNWGVTRGSTGLTLRDLKTGEFMPEPCERPRWGKGIAPHWDYNPWLWVEETAHDPPRNPGYQAVLALNDHTPDMGCHVTLPGGTAFLPQWTREHACTLGQKRVSHRPPADDPIRNYLQPIPLRKGEMVVWTWGQLHATQHNASNKMRLHQYVRMFPAHEVDPWYELHDRYAPQRIWKQYGGDDQVDKLETFLDTTGRRLLGLEEWPVDNEE